VEPLASKSSLVPDPSCAADFRNARNLQVERISRISRDEAGTEALFAQKLKMTPAVLHLSDDYTKVCRTNAGRSGRRGPWRAWANARVSRLVQKVISCGCFW
jgi:hypothetical protein